jgi:hypothetical protein
MNVMKQQTGSILILDDVEVLDFCGPLEVFAMTELAQALSTTYR